MYGGAPKNDQYRKSHTWISTKLVMFFELLIVKQCPSESLCTLVRYKYGVHTIVAFLGQHSLNAMLCHPSVVPCARCPGRLNDFLEGGQVRLDGAGRPSFLPHGSWLELCFVSIISPISLKLGSLSH